jgi:photosystem II stability/assembly factor-like uncharacterized protein
MGFYDNGIVFAVTRLTMPKHSTMRNFNLLLVLLFLEVLALSCKKDDKIQILSYKYDQINSNLNESISYIRFIDSNTGFGVNYSGKVFKTIDKGVNWQSNSLTDFPLKSIYFVNKNIGFIVGDHSSAFKTINDGVSWTELTLPDEVPEINSVYFINENIGFAVGLSFQLKTTNGGAKWNNFEFPVNCLMTKVLFINSQTGFAAGLSGNIFKTTDQGKTWSQTDNISDGHIYDFCFVNGNTGYAAGQKEIVKTEDGGNTWNILTNSPLEIYFIHFADILNGIAIGKGHYTGGDWGLWTSAIYSTSDGGVTWKMEDNINFGSVASFPSGRSGYALGMNSIYKITFE